MQPVSHPNQLGNRVGRHLVHHLGPVDFNRLLRGPELAGNLLVQQSRYHKRHDFAFPCGQRLEPLTEAVELFTIVLADAFLLERLIHRVE